MNVTEIDCIRRIVCHERDVTAVLPTGFGKSAIYQFIRFIRQRSCFLKIKIKAILAKIVTVMVFFVKVGLTLAGYYDFSANISFTFQAFKNLYVHPTYLWFGSFCKFLGNFYIYLEINSF